jgi:hypothetical protein
MTNIEAIKLALAALKLVRAYEKPFDDPYEDVCEAIAAIEALDEPVQESKLICPKCKVDRFKEPCPSLPDCGMVAKAYSASNTAPPRRDSSQERPEWVSLTDEDWDEVANMPDAFDQGVAWAQARLKEKNT